MRACDCFCLGTAMGEGEYRSGDLVIRRMRASDVDGADRVSFGVLGHHRPNPDDEARRARSRARFAHYLAHDADGAWVAEEGGGIVGTSVAIMREGIWGLALFAVAERRQGRGIGRRLLDAALRYGEGSRGGLIMSSEDPKAMRRYARAGFDLRPCVAAAGVLRPDLPEAPEVQEPGRAEAIVRAAPISRAVRGASHGEDIGLMMDAGFRMLMLGDDGYVLHDDGTIRLLAARDDDTAAALMRAAFAQAPRGATVQVDLIAAGHDWAIRTCLDAGLALSCVGPIFTRGDVGPMRPYLPTGAFL